MKKVARMDDGTPKSVYFVYKMVKNWSWIRLAPRKWIKSTVSNLQRKSICSLYLKEVNHHTLEAVHVWI